MKKILLIILSLFFLTGLTYNTITKTLIASSTPISGGTNNYLLYDNNGIMKETNRVPSAYVQGNLLPGWGAAGFLGEYVTASLGGASCHSLTSSVDNNIISIGLTTGNWLVFGTAGFQVINSTSNNLYTVGINSTSNPGDITAYGSSSENATFNFPTPAVFSNVTSTTTHTLVVNVSFPTGTVCSYGTIRALRVM